MISVVYITNRGLSPFTSPAMAGRSQFEVLAQSLDAQTYRDFELVIVSSIGGQVGKFDGPPSTTLRRPRWTPWSETWAKSIATARNTGLRVAQGDTIMGLDDCVSFGPGLLAQVADYAARGLYLAPACMREDGTVLPSYAPGRAGGIVAYPRQLARDLGGHEERFNGCVSLEDWEFAERLHRNGVVFAHDDSARVTLHDHPPGIASYHRCGIAVYGLVRGQSVANRLWSEKELDTFALPVCSFLVDGVCSVVQTPCQAPRRPSAEAVNIMRTHESDHG